VERNGVLTLVGLQQYGGVRHVGALPIAKVERKSFSRLFFMMRQ
jgi:hypothetical protein